MVYGGKLTRFDRRTGQVENIAPKPIRTADFRMLRTAPVVFSPVDPHVLYFAANTLWKTRDGGRSWQQISPDLSRKTWELAGECRQVSGHSDCQADAARRHLCVGAFAARHQPYLGRDRRRLDPCHGGRRTALEGRDAAAAGPFAKVSILDAGHFDALTAYAAINTLRLDDMRPHILRTHDGGKTWTEIVNWNSRWRARGCGARRSQAQRACCSRAPSARCMFRSTTAITGNRCG